MLPIRMWQDLEGRLDVTVAAASSLLILVTVVLAVGDGAGRRPVPPVAG